MKTVKIHPDFSPYSKAIFASRFLALFCLAAAILSSCSKAGISVQKPTPEKAQGECVVLIHGMARTLHSMDEMQERLVAEGYHTVNLGYPSTRKTIEKIVADHFPEALQQCRQFQPTAIHFVSHSLGGIVLRTVFKDQKPENLGRVVMLSPPKSGQ